MPNNNIPSLNQIKQMLGFIEQLFVEVRPLILENAGKEIFLQKNDGSPVTETDKKVENYLLDKFRNAYPDFPVYGEESGYENDIKGAFWLFDPIDGTASFIKNIPAFTCMAVLIVNGIATASIVYNPSSNDVFTAIKSNGAFKNGQKLDLTKIPYPKIAYCKGRYIEKLGSILEPVGVTCKIGAIGAGYGHSLVAEGLSAARFQLNSGGYAHDYATGSLLVAEAGGKIILVNDKELNYETRSFVVCHPAIADQISKHIEEIKQMEIDLA
jgi:fructose-1,6-bisphosphatase/inositol monophosphatase family enzyme